MTNWSDMTKVVPAGKSGNVEVEHLVITEAQARLDAVLSMGKGAVSVSPGNMCRLLINGRTMMSDTTNEKRTNWEAVYRAKGDVLIAGLGLGMVLVPVLCKPEVRSVRVVELSPDVVALVEKPVRAYVGGYEADKLTVSVGDIFDFRPTKGQQWNTIYFDIWEGVCTDNLPDIAKLKRRFCHYLAPGGWMGAWVEHELRRRRRHEREQERYYR